MYNIKNIERLGNFNKAHIFSNSKTCFFCKNFKQLNKASKTKEFKATFNLKKYNFETMIFGIVSN